MKAQIADLEKEKETALQEINERWSRIVEEEKEIPVAPARKDILMDIFGVAWFPYYIVQVGEETIELPGFGK